MAESVIKSYFPSQVASDIEKASEEYGLKVAKSIEHEWFGIDSGTNRFLTNYNVYHKRRLYARGEQSIQKYKNELAIDGDLSYLNIDWNIVPIIPKFVDILVNGINSRGFKTKAQSLDDFGLSKRSSYMQSVLRDMDTRALSDFAAENFGVNIYENAPQTLPDSIEELELGMQLSWKDSMEIAEEQALHKVFKANNYEEEIKWRLIYDLVVCGIACAKNNFYSSKGITLDYVDPANVIYSYTESPYFDDIYYVGEVKTITINELKLQFPNLTEKDLQEIQKQGIQYRDYFNRGVNHNNSLDKNSVQILYFNWKTYANEVYKVKDTSTGASKIIIKDDTFNPPEDQMEEHNFSKLSRQLEVLYEGALILGTNKLVQWEIAKNMVRPKSDNLKVNLNYAMCAPKIYQGRIESTVSRIEGFGDLIQLTHLKLQQVISRMVPDGIFLDADGLTEVDLGNGTTYNPAEALKMFFQTGSIVGRRYTMDGEFNHANVPIQEIQSGSGNNKIPVLVNTYNFYLQMIRDATGLNEAVDGSTPDKDALVGIQKMAAANSNTATRHVLKGLLYITKRMAEGVSIRVSDVIEYSESSDSFLRSLGINSMSVLQDMQELYLHDFGLEIELEPDDEEKAYLENNIQVALSKDLIDLEDAIDVRDIGNLKLANELLKLRKRKKMQRDMQIQQANIEQQTNANIRTQQAAAELEAQKQQMKAESEIMIDRQGSQYEIEKLVKEAELKKELMLYEFQLNMALKEKETEIFKAQEGFKEDRKDKRTKIQATQQSKMIEQRDKNTGAQNFESSGHDTIGSGFDLEKFDPR
jgi:hypothetical protein